jgi:lipopolysaccharide export system protein LptA
MACNFHAAMRCRLTAPLPALLVALTVALSTAAPAVAQRSDRSQPMTIEADRQSTVDLAKRIVVFVGNVVITQGSLRITAERVEVRESPEGWRSAVAFGEAGRPATFRQKRDGVDEVIEGRADRLDYDGRADTVRLAGNALLRRLRGAAPADEVTGALITYDNVNETFSVSAGEGGGRVRAILTPRESAPAGSRP